MARDLLKWLELQGVPIDAISIAEALWIAQYVLPSEPAAAVPSPVNVRHATFPALTPSTPDSVTTAPPPTPSSASSEHSKRSSDTADPEIDLYGPGANTEALSNSQGMPIDLPNEPMISDAVAIRRTLRVLGGRVPSRHTYLLDEVATERRFANEQVLVPITRPDTTRWLRLHVLIDQSQTMEFWESAIAELRQIVHKAHVFRDIHFWAIYTDTEDYEPEIALYPRSGIVGRRQHPRAIIDRTGRSVILILSDFLSIGWRSNSIGLTLHTWTRYLPVALLQLLPERLSKRSSLGREISTGIRTTLPAQPNSQLRHTATLSRLAVRSGYHGIPFPVLSLSSQSIGDWARMLAGDIKVLVNGVLITEQRRSYTRPQTISSPDRIESIGQQRVQRFMSHTSTPGIQLARLLAAAPVISLPLARIIQREMLNSSDLSHLAEVFFGGILKPIVTDEQNASHWYNFVGDARKHLLRQSSHDDKAQIYTHLSQYIAQHRTNRTNEVRFNAFVEVPDAITGSLPVAVQQAFASASVEILRDLGYYEVAETLQKSKTHQSRELRIEGEAPAKADEKSSLRKNELIRTGDINIGTNQTINSFFGVAPTEDVQRQLHDYLVALLDDHRMLRLSRMTERRQSRTGQSLPPPLRLQDVFTSLTTDGPTVIVHERRRAAVQILRLLKRLRLEARTAVACAPEQIRALRIDSLSQRGAQAWGAAEQRSDGVNRDALIAALEAETPDTMLTLTLYRPEIAIEAIAKTPRLVLLGAPGGGKSTALRYLALLLAQHLLDPSQAKLPLGWESAPVPVLCPLGAVADAVESAPAGREVEALWGALEQLLDGGGVRGGLGRHLRPALLSGAAMLLLDGLDELPAAPGPGGRSPRARMSAAIHGLARTLSHTTRIVVTCRTLPYAATPADAGADWRLSPDGGWQTRTIQPLAFGQVRQFVASWYDAACQTAASIYDPHEGQRRSALLIEQLEHSTRVQRLIESPLLLTMLAILHYNREASELPRDRARLYDECVQLLLERWEPVRTPEMKREGLLQRLGIADRASSDDLRAVLHRVAFEAHRRPSEPGDGRGVLRGAELEGELLRFFRRLQVDQLAERVRLFTSALREDAGLLHELGDDAYAFTYLTFQEFLAACALANDPELTQRAYKVWGDSDGDRWREVLLLMVGRLRQQGKVETQGVPWLEALLRAKTPSGGEKTPAQRSRDGLLAADSYQEWEGRAALVSIEPEELEQKLVKSLLPLLEPIAATADRVRAGTHLGRLGDPRPGVCTLAPEWCEVPGRTFLIGSSDTDPQAYGDEAPQRTVDLPTFQISRYPVTNAQWQRFIDAGGYQEPRWWSEAGWVAKEGRGWSQPEYWDNPRFALPNQPVVGISWYEANTYCRWLSAELGYEVRLPSEAEWEKAARGTDGQIYPWGNMWDVERANTYESGIGAPSAVGCYPHGASPYGALDMSGNVWEWTATPWSGNYQEADGTQRESEDGRSFVWRGGAWSNYRRNARCAFRSYNHPSTRYYDLGVRVVGALTRI